MLSKLELGDGHNVGRDQLDCQSLGETVQWVLPWGERSPAKRNENPAAALPEQLLVGPQNYHTIWRRLLIQRKPEPVAWPRSCAVSPSRIDTRAAEGTQ